MVTVWRINAWPQALRFLPQAVFLLDFPDVAVLGHSRLLIVEINQAVGGNDRAVLLAGRRIDVGEFRNIVPISGRLPDHIDFLSHVEVAGGEIPRLVSCEVD